MCAWAEPAGTGVGAVCVERGEQTWPKKMFNHIHKIKTKKRHFTLVRSVKKRPFPLGTSTPPKKGSGFALARLIKNNIKP